MLSGSEWKPVLWLGGGGENGHRKCFVLAESGTQGLVSHFSRVRPSSTCGPFRTLNTMYEAGTVWVRRLEHAGSGASWLPWLHHFLVENTFFLFLASALLL